MTFTFRQFANGEPNGLRELSTTQFNIRRLVLIFRSPAGINLRVMRALSDRDLGQIRPGICELRFARKNLDECIVERVPIDTAGKQVGISLFKWSCSHVL